MRTIFVSHPYAGKPENAQAINEICRKLVKLGVMPISPVNMFSFLDDSKPWDRELALKFCEELLTGYSCEIWFFGDWEKSEGCYKEYLTALLELVTIRVVIGWDGCYPFFKEGMEPEWLRRNEIE